MIHSTSLRATGSEMVASTRVASSALPPRTLSMALWTSASASEVCGVGVCVSGNAGGCGKPVPAPRGPDAAALAGGGGARRAGRGGGGPGGGGGGGGKGTGRCRNFAGCRLLFLGLGRCCLLRNGLRGLSRNFCRRLGWALGPALSCRAFGRQARGHRQQTRASE